MFYCQAGGFRMSPEMGQAMMGAAMMGVFPSGPMLPVNWQQAMFPAAVQAEQFQAAVSSSRHVG